VSTTIHETTTIGAKEILTTAGFLAQQVENDDRLYNLLRQADLTKAGRMQQDVGKLVHRTYEMVILDRYREKMRTYHGRVAAEEEQLRISMENTQTQRRAREKLMEKKREMEALKAKLLQQRKIQEVVVREAEKLAPPAPPVKGEKAGAREKLASDAEKLMDKMRAMK
jgi:hypothetical protein